VIAGSRQLLPVDVGDTLGFLLKATAEQLLEIAVGTVLRTGQHLAGFVSVREPPHTTTSSYDIFLDASSRVADASG
jgi:hypothetical protein